MRIAFQKTLLQQCKKNKNVILITGDLGYSALEPFRDNFPSQFINAGVAEQNMMGIAAGLALSGKIVFAYSIATFASMRAFEQIRDDIAYHNVPVRIIGVGGGFSYGHMGVTHYAIEDIAIMRSLPNMAVVCPIDPLEVQSVIDFSVRYKGPMYIRLGKTGEKEIFKTTPAFSLGEFSLLRDSGNVAIFVTGPLAQNAIIASDILLEHGVKCAIVGASSVKPIDAALVKKMAGRSRLIVSIEEHNIIGGLGSALAEELTKERGVSPLLRLGIPDEFPKYIGSQEYLRKQYGLSPDKIADAILRALKQYSPPRQAAG